MASASTTDWKRRRVGALVGALVVTVLCGRDAPRPDHLHGPGSDGTWYAVGGAAAVGETLSFGSFVALADGEDRKLTVESIDLVGVEGLRTVGVAVHGPDRSFGMIGALPGFPPPELQGNPLSLPGAVVPDGDPGTRRAGLAVTFGVRRDEAGRGWASGFTVTYRVGGDRHRVTFRTGITLCAFDGYVRGLPTSPRCE